MRHIAKTPSYYTQCVDLGPLIKHRVVRLFIFVWPSMLFVRAPSFPQARRRTKQGLVCSQCISPEALNISFDSAAKAGNFGRIFFGEYTDPVDPSTATREVVVKCPVASDIGRQLYAMEKYTNVKLREKANDKSRFPHYLGEVIIPEGLGLMPDLVGLGLVWQRAGSGDTLEDYFTSSRLMQLASLLGAFGNTMPLRRDLCARVLYELALILRDLQQSGIVHR